MMIKKYLNGFIYRIALNVKNVETLQILYVRTIDHIDI